VLEGAIPLSLANSDYGRALQAQGWMVEYVWDDWEDVKVLIEKYFALGGSIP
jgi:hypothetical protein